MIFKVQYTSKYRKNNFHQSLRTGLIGVGIKRSDDRLDPAKRI